MQYLLDKLHGWCKRWRVLINTDKSKLMHFRKGKRKQSVYQFTIGNKTLEFTNSYKYLCVIFTDKLNFNLNAENLDKVVVEPWVLSF